MTAMDELTVNFEEQRTHRRGGANRLVGSTSRGSTTHVQRDRRDGAWPPVVIVMEES